MVQIWDGKITQCQNALKKHGVCFTNAIIPDEVRTAIVEENFSKLDQIFKELFAFDGQLFQYLIKFTPFDISHIEHIISLREAKNEWEEDGIWHDDGSRVLAFTISLTSEEIEGGVLEFRKKGDEESQKLPTAPFGHMIIFKTGVDNFEHKINRVTKGSRLIIAGWLYLKED